MTPRERAEALLAEGVPMGRIGMVAFRGRIEATIRAAEAEAYERAAKAARESGKHCDEEFPLGYRTGWDAGCVYAEHRIRALASKEQR